VSEAGAIEFNGIVPASPLVPPSPVLVPPHGPHVPCVLPAGISHADRTAAHFDALGVARLDVSYFEKPHVAALHCELLREILDELAVVASEPQNLSLHRIVVGHANLAGSALFGGLRLRGSHRRAL